MISGKEGTIVSKILFEFINFATSEYIHTTDKRNITYPNIVLG